MAAVTNMADAAAFIEQARALGVYIATDDFGAGPASVSYLETMMVTLPKIDGNFTRNLINDPLNDNAVCRFEEVARVVGVKTVAEFIDMPEALERVRDNYIDFA